MTEIERKTLNEIINEIGFGLWHLRSIAVFSFLATTDAMELILIAIIGPVLQCEWSLSSTEVAYISLSVVLGMMLGALLFGYLSDNYGRRPVLLLANLMVILYSSLSVFSPNYYWIIILRGLTGMGLATCMANAWILYTELTPAFVRAKAMLLISFCWSVGVITTVLVAAIVIPTIGWRYLIAFCTIPMLMSFILVYYFVSESPSYLITQNDYDKALRVINQIAQFNHKPTYTAITQIKTISEHETGNFLLMFSKKYLSTSLILFIVWFVQGFCYYGAILVTTTLPQTLKEECPYFFHYEKVDSSCCSTLNWSNYLGMIFSALGEMLSYPCCVMLCDYVGRRWSLKICLTITAILIPLLSICAPMYLSNLILFLWNVFIVSTMYTYLIYTTEVYPTVIRASSFGLCNGFARLGTMLTSFVAQVVLPDYSLMGALLIYSGSAMFAAFCCCFLPFETRNRGLTNQSDETISASSSSADLQTTDYRTFNKSS